MLQRRQPEDEGEWFQLIVDQLHNQEQSTERLARTIADHDARIKILEQMYWRVTGVFIASSGIIGFLEWLLSRH